MTIFNSYSIGTASVVLGGTIVTGSGTLWSGINAKPGDDLVLDGHTVVIMDVIDTTHLQIEPWPYASVPTGVSPAAPYKIIWRSPIRYAGGQAMADVDSLITTLTNAIFPTINGGASASSTLTLQSTTGIGTTDAIIFKTGSQVERSRIESGGRLLHLGRVRLGNGTYDAGYAEELHTNTGAANTMHKAHVYWGTTGDYAAHRLFTSPSGTIGVHQAVVANGGLGAIDYGGSDGTSLVVAAGIDCFVDGTVAIGNIPSRLSFLTCAPGGFILERMRIDNEGKTTITDIGTAGSSNCNVSIDSQGARHQVVDQTARWHDSWHAYTNNSAPAAVVFSKTRNASPYSHTIDQNNDRIGGIFFYGSDGANYIAAARIQVEIDGTPGTNDMPGRMLFYTTADGSASLIERLRINNAGAVIASGSLTSSGSGGIGYSTGAGGAVTQTGSRTTAVTINKPSGAITLVSAAGSSSATSFTVNNSTVAATDTINIGQKSGTDKYTIRITNIAAGSFEVTFVDNTGTTTEQPVFNFNVIKGVTS